MFSFKNIAIDFQVTSSIGKQIVALWSFEFGTKWDEIIKYTEWFY